MKSKAKKVIKHLHGDIKTFKHEADEDRKLIKSLKSDSKKHEKKESVKHEKAEKKKPAPAKPGHKKFKKVMEEFKSGTLHSGSKTGPKVTNLSQARAIGFSEDRKSDKTAKKPKHKKK